MSSEDLAEAAEEMDLGLQHLRPLADVVVKPTRSFQESLIKNLL